MSWTRSDFFALAARLNANGIEEARPPNEDETAGAYLALLYGWVMDACTRKADPEPKLPQVTTKREARAAGCRCPNAPEWHVNGCPLPLTPVYSSAADHLIDHDAEALLKGKTLDPEKRGVEFTYKRGSF